MTLCVICGRPLTEHEVINLLPDLRRPARADEFKGRPRCEDCRKVADSKEGQA